MLGKLVIPFFFLFSAASSLASMTISGTRIIFPGNEKEVTIRTNNKGSKPALVQVWVDDGDINADLNETDVPFITTPPVFRVEPGKGQSVRLIYNGSELPQDRESIFWFNLLEVPPLYKDTANVDRLELAFRTRIKIFYRPKTLTSSSAGQMEKIQWQVLPGNKGVSVINNTPYYLSFDRAALQNGGGSGELDTAMVAPFGSASFLLKKGAMAGVTGATIRLINDYGAAIEKKLILSADNKLLLQNN
ncbi:molecular chaperone [Kalamiella sp. sgz302252]|uniref:fimbrial biogenesis chaperone n=1 Tax=Pantoea sp. sgz302252 TaxID=3341827 RepID=UPI0036D2172C